MYTGSEKKLSDPQVQFGQDINIGNIQAAKLKVDSTEAAYIKAQNDLKDIMSYADKIEGITNTSYDATAGKWTITTDTDSKVYTKFDQLTEDGKTAAKATYDALIASKALDSKNKMENLYFDENGNCIIGSEAEAWIAGNDLYSYNKIDPDGNDRYTSLSAAVATAEEAYNQAIEEYNNLSHPTYVGNSKLNPIADLTADQEAEIAQIVRDMKEQGITSDIINYYDPDTGKYDGGIYSFKMNGITYYTTITDLENSYLSGTGINNIDGQAKLPYYNATYVSTKIEETQKALVETDGYGRFSSIRFEDDSITYTLSMETVTDDVAYQDAMNQYYYENAKYDKTIQDINDKTSIIQREDQQLELRLKQLDTERNALQTEMEAVQGIVKKNVEETFKTFGG